MMFRSFFIAAIALCGLMAGPCGAQSRRDTPPPGIGNDNDVGVNQLTKFGIYDVFKARAKENNKEGKSIKELIAEDKAEASALVSSLKLQCTVIDAILVAVDKEALTRTYEVACDNGLGYFLVRGDPPAKPTGFTCLAADAARRADIAAHRPPSIGCGLPENTGANAIIGSILKKAGKTCTVTEHKWLGQSTTTDFVELACAEGTGFILRSPLPGSTVPLRIATCAESAANGLDCRLPANDTTLATLNAVLARHNVSCTASAVRVVGHESVKRRRVVEFFCPAQQPGGLVAFLPAEGSKAPFEIIDCDGAAKRQVICTLTKTK